ncbi:MAG: long-chain-fatty-acid--CoA ligase [Acidimicrobiia bacterium]
MSTTIDTIAGIVRVHGRARGDAPALEYQGTTTTYAELDDASNRVANAMAALGVTAGERVALLDKNAPSSLELLFGLNKLGAVLVPVNWRLAAEEIAQILHDARPRVLVVGSEFFATVEAIETDVAMVSTILAIGSHPRWPSYESARNRAAADDPGHVGHDDDVVVQLYTSGTTGAPKGVMITNRNLFAGHLRMAGPWNIDASSVSLTAMPLFHIGGVGWALTGMVEGCTTVLVREFDAEVVLAAISEYGVTSTLLVPAMIQRLLAAPNIATVDFTSLQTLVYSASPVSDTLLLDAMRTFGCDFVQLYGTTETTGVIVQLDAADHDPERRPHLLRSCGKALPGVEVRLVDPQTGDAVVPGAVGEVWTRSEQNMAGYWGMEEATSTAVTADGWYRTGDAAYEDAEGYLYLHDRLKDVVISGGENVYPAEVENVLARHPGVADVAVIGVPDDRWGEAVKAVVVRSDTATVTEADLIAFAREHLGGYKVPKSVDFTDVLPRNPSGKLLKRVIREPYWRGRERRIS